MTDDARTGGWTGPRRAYWRVAVALAAGAAMAGCASPQFAGKVDNGGDAPPFATFEQLTVEDLSAVGPGDALAFVLGNVSAVTQSNTVRIDLMIGEAEAAAEAADEAAPPPEPVAEQPGPAKQRWGKQAQDEKPPGKQEQQQRQIAKEDRIEQREIQKEQRKDERLAGKEEGKGDQHMRLGKQKGEGDRGETGEPTKQQRKRPKWGKQSDGEGESGRGPEGSPAAAEDAGKPEPGKQRWGKQSDDEPKAGKQDDKPPAAAEGDEKSEPGKWRWGKQSDGEEKPAKEAGGGERPQLALLMRARKGPEGKYARRLELLRGEDDQTVRIRLVLLNRGGGKFLGGIQLLNRLPAGTEFMRTVSVGKVTSAGAVGALWQRMFGGGEEFAFEPLSYKSLGLRQETEGGLVKYEVDGYTMEPKAGLAVEYELRLSKW